MERAGRAVECVALDSCGPGLRQDVRRGLGRHPPLSQPAAERPHAGDRCCLLDGRRTRALRSFGLAFPRAAHPAILSRPRRDPGHSLGATVRGAAGAGVESASVRVLGTVLVLIGLPVALALTEAISFYVSNRNNGTILDREYLLHVPASYDPTKPTPLVISMHAAGLWPAAQMEISRWNELADRQGFIVVYPSGAKSSGPRIFHVDKGPARMRDVRFISELIDKLEATYNIDPRRIYANGLSGLRTLLHDVRSDRGRRDGGGCTTPAVQLVYRRSPGADDCLSRDGRSGCSVQRRDVVGRARFVSKRPDLDQELGSKKRVRAEPERCCGGRGRHPSRLHGLRSQCGRGALHDPRRRSHLARRQAAAGMVRRNHQPQHRRHEPDVGVLPRASARESVVRLPFLALEPRRASAPHRHGVTRFVALERHSTAAAKWS
ncbi:MAG: hypothetical protein E6J88_09410 [Deltaproteobacteria bacterium]|nr:MAG: hypothetical protein E6J88_09410 [Deltaproteobacteria bacterium]